MSGGGKGGGTTTVPRYYADVQMVLGLGVYDHISRISFADDRIAWEGQEEGDPAGYGEIVINKPGLYGGDQAEGGVSGSVEVGMGYPDQPRSSYLQEKLDAFVSAHRGITTLVWRDFYWGNNPYPKSPKVRAQSIHRMWDGSLQWYDEKAEIRTSENEFLASAYDISFDSAVDDDVYESGIGEPYPPPGALRITTENNDDYIKITMPPGGEFTAWSPWDSDTGGPAEGAWTCSVVVSVDGAPPYVVQTGTSERVYAATPEAARAGFGEVVVTGGKVYDFFLKDTPRTDNRGGVSPHIELWKRYRTGDINPAHFLRETHTDPIWGANFPDAKMGSTYTTCADTLFEEGLGISPLFTESISYKDIIAEVIRHIDAIAYEDNETKLMELKLIRPDFDVETLPVLHPGNSELESITRPEDFEVANQVIIHFWDRETGKDGSVTLDDPSAIDMAGKIVTQEFEYPFITRKSVAMQVAQRDLARATRPFSKGQVRTNRKYYNLKPGDVFKLNAPDENVSQMICRVAERKEGGILNGDIILDFGEDVFGAGYTTYALPPASGWVDPIGDPQGFPYETAFEMPYYLLVKQLGERGVAELDAESCFFGFAGAEPATGAHQRYDLYAYPDGTVQEPDLEFAAGADFTPVGIIANDADEKELTLELEPLEGMDSVRVGHLVMVGDSLDAECEFLVVDAAPGEGATTLSVLRGLADTVPRRITAGTVLYFVGTFYGNSDTEFGPGETVEGYGTPRNGRGAFEGPFIYHDVDMDGRFNKPYPPGNLKIDGESYPGDWYVPPAQQVVFTWSHRDRVLQSDQTIDFFDDTDYGPEASTTYLVEADAYDSDGVLITANWFSFDVGLVKTYTLDLDVDVPPANTVTIVVRVWTVRDTELSLQAATYTFLYNQELIADEYTGLPILDVDGNYLAAETI